MADALDIFGGTATAEPPAAPQAAPAAPTAPSQPYSYLGTDTPGSAQRRWQGLPPEQPQEPQEPDAASVLSFINDVPPEVLKGRAKQAKAMLEDAPENYADLPPEQRLAKADADATQARQAWGQQFEQRTFRQDINPNGDIWNTQFDAKNAAAQYADKARFGEEQDIPGFSYARQKEFLDRVPGATPQTYLNFLAAQAPQREAMSQAISEAANGQQPKIGPDQAAQIQHWLSLNDSQRLDNLPKGIDAADEAAVNNYRVGLQNSLDAYNAAPHSPLLEQSRDFVQHWIDTKGSDWQKSVPTDQEMADYAKQRTAERAVAASDAAGQSFTRRQIEGVVNTIGGGLAQIGGQAIDFYTSGLPDAYHTHIAREFSHFNQDTQNAISAADKQFGYSPGWQYLRGALGMAGTAALAGPFGAGAVEGLLSAGAMTNGVQEAADKGLSSGEATIYGVAQGALSLAVMKGFRVAGLGGLQARAAEIMAGDTTSKTLADAAKAFPNQWLKTGLEMFPQVAAIGVGGVALRDQAGVDPGSFNAKNVGNEIQEALINSIVTSGLLEAGNVAGKGVGQAVGALRGPPEQGTPNYDIETGRVRTNAPEPMPQWNAEARAAGEAYSQWRKDPDNAGKAVPKELVDPIIDAMRKVPRGSGERPLDFDLAREILSRPPPNRPAVPAGLLGGPESAPPAPEPPRAPPKQPPSIDAAGAKQWVADNIDSHPDLVRDLAAKADGQSISRNDFRDAGIRGAVEGGFTRTAAANPRMRFAEAVRNELAARDATQPTPPPAVPPAPQAQSPQKAALMKQLDIAQDAAARSPTSQGVQAQVDSLRAQAGVGPPPQAPAPIPEPPSKNRADDMKLLANAENALQIAQKRFPSQVAEAQERVAKYRDRVGQGFEPLQSGDQVHVMQFAGGQDGTARVSLADAATGKVGVVHNDSGRPGVYQREQLLKAGSPPAAQPQPGASNVQAQEAPRAAAPAPTAAASGPAPPQVADTGGRAADEGILREGTPESATPREGAPYASLVADAARSRDASLSARLDLSDARKAGDAERTTAARQRVRAAEQAEAAAHSAVFAHPDWLARKAAALADKPESPAPAAQQTRAERMLGPAIWDDIHNDPDRINYYLGEVTKAINAASNDRRIADLREYRILLQDLKETFDRSAADAMKRAVRERNEKLAQARAEMIAPADEAIKNLRWHEKAKGYDKIWQQGESRSGKDLYTAKSNLLNIAKRNNDEKWQQLNTAASEAYKPQSGEHPLYTAGEQVSLKPTSGREGIGAVLGQRRDNTVDIKTEGRQGSAGRQFNVYPNEIEYVDAAQRAQAEAEIAKRRGEQFQSQLPPEPERPEKIIVKYYVDEAMEGLQAAQKQLEMAQLYAKKRPGSKTAAAQLLTAQNSVDDAINAWTEANNASIPKAHPGPVFKGDRKSLEGQAAPNPQPGQMAPLSPTEQVNERLRSQGRRPTGNPVVDVLDALAPDYADKSAMQSLRDATLGIWGKMQNTVMGTPSQQAARQMQDSWLSHRAEMMAEIQRFYQYVAPTAHALNMLPSAIRDALAQDYSLGRDPTMDVGGKKLTVAKLAALHSELREYFVDIGKRAGIEDPDPNYWKGIWVHPDGRVAIIGKQGLAGTQGFKMTSTFSTPDEGLAAGFRPADNYLGALMLAAREHWASIAFDEWFDQFTSTGDIPWQLPGSRVPDEYVIGKAPQFEVRMPNEKTFYAAVDAKKLETVQQIEQNLGLEHIQTSPMNKTTGSYKNGTVRTRFGSFDVSAWHEAFHGIDDRLGLWDAMGGDDLLDHTNQIGNQLRDLADARLGTYRSGSQVAYVRSRQEMMANAGEAFMDHPDQMRQLAPQAYQRLEDFIRAHRELAPLLETSDGVRKAEQSFTVRGPGYVVAGHWALPKTLNNYFENLRSRGLVQTLSNGGPASQGAGAVVQGIMGLNNVLNADQLFGPFHAGGTTRVGAGLVAGIGPREMVRGAKKMLGGLGQMAQGAGLASAGGNSDLSIRINPKQLMGGAGDTVVGAVAAAMGIPRTIFEMGRGLTYGPIEGMRMTAAKMKWNPADANQKMLTQANRYVAMGGKFAPDPIGQITHKLYNAIRDYMDSPGGLSSIVPAAKVGALGALWTPARLMQVVLSIAKNAQTSANYRVASYDLAHQPEALTPPQALRRANVIQTIGAELLGQVDTDRMNINRVAEDALRILWRSPRWLGGSIFFPARLLADVVSTPVRAMAPRMIRDPLGRMMPDPTGRVDENGEPTTVPRIVPNLESRDVITPRMYAAMGLFITWGAIGSVLNRWLTGEWPKELKDAYWPRDGTVGQDGSANRINPMPILSQPFGWAYSHGHSLANSFSPIVQIISDLLSNRTWDGNMVYDPHDAGPGLRDYALRQFKPFSEQYIETSKLRNQDPWKSAATSAMGINAAPGWMQRDDYMASAAEYQRLQGHPVLTPLVAQQREKDRIDRAGAKQEAGIAGLKAELQSEVDAGTLPRKSMDSQLKAAAKSPQLRALSNVRGVDAATTWDARADVYSQRKIGGEEDTPEIHGLMLKSLGSRLNGAPAALPQVIAQADQLGLDTRVAKAAMQDALGGTPHAYQAAAKAYAILALRESGDTAGAGHKYQILDKEASKPEPGRDDPMKVSLDKYKQKLDAWNVAQQAYKYLHLPKNQAGGQP